MQLHLIQGVTTGPMTVPFIMALGVGISSIRNDKHASNDSFGLVSLCSIGPILAVLILGMVYSTEGNFTTTAITEVSDSVELGKLFLYEIPKYLKEIALSLLPIVVFFGVFQIFAPKMNKKSLMKICVGLVYTYIGLVLFLTGANVGFIPAGNYLGSVLASLSFRWIIVPTGMIIGYFIVKGRACCICAYASGRRTDIRKHIRQINADKSFCRCCSICWPFNDKSADRHLNIIFSYSGLWNSTDTYAFCS